MKRTYAVGIIIVVNGENKLVVDSVSAHSSAEALGKMIMGHDSKVVKDWSVKTEIDQEVAELVKNGKKIGAIKLVREERGIGLKEAKHYVDGLKI